MTRISDDSYLHLRHARQHIEVAERIWRERDITVVLQHLKDAREDLRWAILLYTREAAR